MLDLASDVTRLSDVESRMRTLQDENNSLNSKVREDAAETREMGLKMTALERDIEQVRQGYAQLLAAANERAEIAEKRAGEKMFTQSEVNEVVRSVINDEPISESSDDNDSDMDTTEAVSGDTSMD